MGDGVALDEPSPDDLPEKQEIYQLTICLHMPRIVNPGAMGSNPPRPSKCLTGPLE